MSERNVGMDDVQNLLENKKGFDYNYNGEARKGFWDQESKVFISATEDNKVTTVIKGSRVEKYVEGLKKKSD